LADRTHWIFDLDGTLTVAAHDFELIRSKLGVPPRTPILEYMRALPEVEASAMNDQLHEIEMEIALRSRPQPGVQELLGALSSAGKRLGIVTRNSEHIAKETLRVCEIDGFFGPKDILGRDSIVPKPSPDGIHTLLDRWDATPEDAVMVGDYLFDIQSGRQAGTATVYLDSAGHGEFSAEADATVSSLSDLHKLLSQSTDPQAD